MHSIRVKQMVALVSSSIVGLAAAGCGGSCPEAASAASAEPAQAAPTDAKAAEGRAEPPGGSAERGEPHEDKASAKVAEPPAPEGGAEKASAAEPAFPPDASVAQAMKAVPQGTSRANIDPERLAEPLQKESLYEPCNSAGQHFKLNVAVWNGQAVGVDVATPNRKLAACIDKQVRTIEWPDKVRSLNTVQYSM